MVAESLQEYRQRAYNCLYDARVRIVDLLNRHVDVLKFPGTPQAMSASHRQTLLDASALRDQFRADRGCQGVPVDESIVEVTEVVIPYLHRLWRRSRMGGFERMWNPAAPMDAVSDTMALLLNTGIHSGMALFSYRHGQSQAKQLLIRGRIPGEAMPRVALRFGFGRFMIFESLAFFLRVPFLMPDENTQLPRFYYTRPEALRLHVSTLFPSPTL